MKKFINISVSERVKLRQGNDDRWTDIQEKASTTYLDLVTRTVALIEINCFSELHDFSHVTTTVMNFFSQFGFPLDQETARIPCKKLSNDPFISIFNIYYLQCVQIHWLILGLTFIAL